MKTFLPEPYEDVVEKFNRFFEKYRLLEEVRRNDIYFDEPRQYYFSAFINTKSPYFKLRKYTTATQIYGAGNSFFNKPHALVKCLGETVERMCQEVFDTDQIIYSTYKNIRDQAIDPRIHIGDSVKDRVLGWVNGKNIVTDKPILIPAQHAHYSFLDFKKEPAITSLISTGGACGRSHKTTLLAGLYELVERDAFTTTYLLKAPIKRIDINKIENDQISFINESCKKYHLQWIVLDVTNDLEIPTYFSILIDKTGVGPAVTVGANSNLNPYLGIIKSVGEAFMTRPWIRYVMSSKAGYQAVMNVESRGIRKRLERAVFWFPVARIKKISFWTKLKPRSLEIKKHLFDSPKQELEYVLAKLQEKNFPVYYCDLTHEELKPFGFSVYKVINPNLHPLYLNEKNRVIDYQRLKQVAHYFGIKKVQINPVPHPFL